MKECVAGSPMTNSMKIRW